jgi:hypothetical protein
MDTGVSLGSENIHKKKIHWLIIIFPIQIRGKFPMVMFRPRKIGGLKFKA